MSGPDITVPDLAALAERRSEKWASEAPGVLAMTVAEMDFPLAPPVSAVLREALERGDVGYPAASPPGCSGCSGPSWRRACRGCAGRRRVALGSGPRYGATGFVRLNFATSPELVAEGVRRMAAVLPGAA